MNPIIPPPDSSSWGFFEWLTTFLTPILTGTIWFVAKTRSKLMIHEKLLEEQGNELQEIKKNFEATRDKIASFPSRDDILRIQTMIESRFDRIDQRVDYIIKNGKQ